MSEVTELLRGAKMMKNGCEKLARTSYNSMEWGILECTLLQGEGELHLEGTAEKAQELIEELAEAYAEQKARGFYGEISKELGLESGAMTPHQEVKQEELIKEYILQNL